MLNSIIGSEITVSAFFICTAVSLVLGIGTALVGMFGTKSSQSFAITVAILPAVVQTVIMLVNGNIGAGVAVAGAFGLVRFRSAPGTAKEICAIFLSMAIGLATGMGYVWLAALLFVIVAAAMIVLTKFDFGAKKTSERTLKITIPENLDYDGLFDDIFEKYAKEFSLEKAKKGVIIKTANKCDGIEKGDCSKLFDRFYRQDESRSAGTGGFGIGLSIARSIAEGHRGTAVAKSDDGQSIEFIFHLK